MIPKNTITKIISVLFFISAGLNIFFGINTLIGILFLPLFFNIGNTFSSILSLGLGIFLFFLGRGLWKKRKWTKITAIIITFLGVLISIRGIFKLIMPSFIIQLDVFSPLNNWVYLILNSAIFVYLLFFYKKENFISS